jgi:hypothetical protein
MTRAVAALVFLLGLVCCAEVLGYLTRSFHTFLSVLFLALFLSQHPPRGVLHDLRRRWPAWALVLGALIGVFLTEGWGRVLFVSLLVGGIRWSRTGGARRRWHRSSAGSCLTSPYII